MADACDIQVNFSTFKVSLNGPFVIELHKHPSNPHQIRTLSAFVPADPMLMGKRHQFFLDGELKGEDDGKQHFEFELVSTKKNDADFYGVDPCMRPRFIDPAFDEFRLHTPCDHKSFFVKLELPCPDRITFSRGPAPVIFEVDEHLGYMPLNHVLEYEVAHPNKGIGIRSCQTGTKMIGQKDDSFFFEVGLRKGTDPDNQHALHFYNEVLLSCFPDGKNKRLEAILGTDDKTSPPFSTDVECKVGGGING